MGKIEDGIKKIEDAKKRLETVQKTWVNSPQSKSFAKDIVEQIAKRTRLGKGVDREGVELRSLDALEPSTVENRTRYKKNLSELTGPKKSNLTATGQMLEAITYKFQSGGFLFFFKSGRRGRELSGSEGRTTNAEVARHVSEKRPFFALSRTELNGYAVRLKREFLKLIRGQ